MASIYSLIDEHLPKENADKIKEYTRKCDEELTVMMSLSFALIYTVNGNSFYYCRIYWAMMAFCSIIALLYPHHSISHH